MGKQEFLKALRAKLAEIPQEDREERLGFYSEMIDDRVEEGLTEAQAIAQLGSLEEIARQIMAEIPLTKPVREKVKPARALRAWEIVLLILGAPLWLSLLIALLAVAVAVYAVVWSGLASLWAAEAAVAACAAGGVFAAVVLAAQGGAVPGLMMLGAGLFCAGLGILGFLGCKCATAGLWKLTKGGFLWIKSRFVKKEGGK